MLGDARSTSTLEAKILGSRKYKKRRTYSSEANFFMGYLLIIGIMLDPKKFNRNPQLKVKEGFKKGINFGSYVGLEKHKTESGLPKQL